MLTYTVKTGQSLCSALICRKRSAFEMKFYFTVVSVLIKISKDVISLLWQLRCLCNSDHNKFYSLSNTAAVVVIYAHTWEVWPWKTPSSHLKLNKFTMASLPWLPFPYSPYFPRFSGACVLACALKVMLHGTGRIATTVFSAPQRWYVGTIL